MDLSVVPTGLGFWVPWLPFSLSLRWPFCFFVGAVLDHSSRAVLSTLVTQKEPSAEDVCNMLDRAVVASGRAPRHIISDQGSQFGEDYRGWCKRNGARPRFGAIGQSGSIALIERFFRSLKDECFRRILVPLAPPAMTAELALYVRWYNAHRPHSALGGATPSEKLQGATPACAHPGVEPRIRYPLRRRRKAGSRHRRARGKLELILTHLHGRAHLPVVQLREVA